MRTIVYLSWDHWYKYLNIQYIKMLITNYNVLNDKDR